MVAGLEVGVTDERGGLPLTYHIGPGPAKVHMKVLSDWSQKPIYDVIAQIRGSQEPDHWIIRGNHHDGWVFGAMDPLSGQVALMAEAKAIGQLVKDGWKEVAGKVETSTPKNEDWEWKAFEIDSGKGEVNLRLNNLDWSKHATGVFFVVKTRGEGGKGNAPKAKAEFKSAAQAFFTKSRPG